jgi:ABC-type thiamin/hydroxymethylpyrimidine transport system permease subunit
MRNTSETQSDSWVVAATMFISGASFLFNYYILGWDNVDDASRIVLHILCSPLLGFPTGILLHRLRFQIPWMVCLTAAGISIGFVWLVHFAPYNSLHFDPYEEFRNFAVAFGLFPMIGLIIGVIVQIRRSPESVEQDKPGAGGT